jgi:hypothetical protein
MEGCRIWGLLSQNWPEIPDEDSSPCLPCAQGEKLTTVASATTHRFVEIGGVRAFVQTLPFVCPSWHILRIPLKHLDWLPRPPPRLLEITPGFFFLLKT